jgi:N-acetylglucosamine-6-phosphate deacetylase
VNKFEANVAGVGRCSVALVDGRIDRVDRVGPEDAKTPYCCPGFVDIQINGFAGVDFSSADLRVADVVQMMPSIWATGCTTICPTFITNSVERLQRNLGVLEAARRESRDVALSMPCYHLEGPYLSPGPSHGAHDSLLMHPPRIDEFEDLQADAGNRIGLVTLAPELPGAIEFIRHVSQKNVVVAISHTDGTADDIYKAVAAGATLSTHWGNGCPAVIHRHNAPLWAQLAADQLAVSIICDGFHLPPEHVCIARRIKGRSGCILVTDAVHVAGMPAGRYTLVGRDIELLPDGRVVTVDGQCMAGSSVSMDRAVANFFQVTGLPLSEALRAATEAPARLLRRWQIAEAIRASQPANLVLFQLREGRVHVLHTFLAGRVVYSAN